MKAAGLRFSLLTAALAAIAFCAIVPSPALAAGEALWEYIPYRVQAYLAIAPDAEPCGDLVNLLSTTLDERAFAVIGARWTFSVGPAPLALRQGMIYNFDRLPAEQVLSAELPEECDKVLLVRVSFADGTYEIVTRDFDVRTQLFSPPVRSSVVQRERLGDAAFQSLFAAFAPLGRVETVEKDKVTLRMRAAAVPTREAAISLPRDNTIFQPVIRTLDRAGKPKRVQAVEWTYLVGDALEGTSVACRMVTAYSSPISSRRRGRTEQLALALRPAEEPTTLVLRSADKDARTLVGYSVYSHPVGEKETHLLGVTDGLGRLSIAPDEGQVRVLLIKSGGFVMARLPILPGLGPTAVASVPDDQLRLQVEGLITGFQEELVDLIARRQVLISRIQTQLKAGKKDEAKKLLVDLRKLRTQQDCTRELTVERQRRTTRDPRMQKQIDKLFDDTQTVVNRFLDSRAIDKVDREVNNGPEATKPEGDEEKET